MSRSFDDEISIVRNLTGADASQIRLQDDGFLSRGYLVDGGRLVFKFPKHSDVTYADEIRNLDFLSDKDVGANIQRAVYRPADGGFLGLAGVLGTSLETAPPQDNLLMSAGQQLGAFLRKLHALQPKEAPVYPLDELISAWQRRYERAKPTLAEHLSASELNHADAIMLQKMPDQLRALGEKRVFSHADLGDGNILLDAEGRIGIIDFSESGYADEAADFMDVSDNRLLQSMLDAYGADEILRRKAAIQRQIRPLFVLDVYKDRGKEEVRNKVRAAKLSLETGPL